MYKTALLVALVTLVIITSVVSLSFDVFSNRRVTSCSGREATVMLIGVDTVLGAVTVRGVEAVQLASSNAGASSPLKTVVYRHMVDMTASSPPSSRAIEEARLCVGVHGSTCIRFSSIVPSSVRDGGVFSLRTFTSNATGRKFEYLTVGGYPVYQAPNGQNGGVGNGRISAVNLQGSLLSPFSVLNEESRLVSACPDGQYYSPVICDVESKCDSTKLSMGIWGCDPGADEDPYVPGATITLQSPGTKDSVRATRGSRVYTGEGSLLVENAACDMILLDPDANDDVEIPCEQQSISLPLLREYYANPSVGCENLLVQGNNNVLMRCKTPGVSENVETCVADTSHVCDTHVCVAASSMSGADRGVVNAGRSIKTCPAKVVDARTCEPCRSILDAGACGDHFSYRWLYLQTGDSAGWVKVPHYCALEEKSGYCALAGAITTDSATCSKFSFDMNDASVYLDTAVLASNATFPDGRPNCGKRTSGNYNVYMCDYHTHDPGVYGGTAPGPGDKKCTSAGFV
jgi:hypothetical protein